ncbi:MAG: PQQ-dependent sugar dehydrogenase [Chloroflexota bacterium]|nr:PQQ-dependent sugar dehydrogenase [Chloroflexota bacterium]
MKLARLALAAIMLALMAGGACDEGAEPAGGIPTPTSAPVIAPTALAAPAAVVARPTALPPRAPEPTATPTEAPTPPGVAEVASSPDPTASPAPESTAAPATPPPAAPAVTPAPAIPPAPTPTQPPTPTPAHSPPPTPVPEPTPTPTPAPTPTPTPTPAPPVLRGLTADRVVGGLVRPVYAGHAGDGSGRLFVIEKEGRVRIVVAGQLVPDPFLDLTGIVNSRANERGLLGLAFHPDYASNGRFFVFYTELRGATVVAEYRVSDDPDRADPTSARVLLTQPQPFANHNGGMLAFGPDGMLYVALGDGGAAGDPQNHAQRLDTWLGTLLRLDVSAPGAYRVPSDNPFVGVPDARAEIWAYGLRNPWRFSFDRATGDLYIADVGQNSFEEIDFAPASSTGGENYGWKLMEGFSCFVEGSPECNSLRFTDPVAVYGRDGGCSVTGGYVYRGSAYPALAGAYVFGDYCSGNVWTLRRDAAGTWQMRLQGELDARITSFGEDEAGELYITDDQGRLLRVRARS